MVAAGAAVNDEGGGGGGEKLRTLWRSPTNWLEPIACRSPAALGKLAASGSANIGKLHSWLAANIHLWPAF